MRKTLFSLVFLSAMPVAIASAADMPIKAPPMAVPTYSWAGPYIGIAGGVGSGNSSQTDPGTCTFFLTCNGATFDGSYSLFGGIVGGTLGFDTQRGPWVLGVEGDYSWADISGSSNACGVTSPAPHPCGTQLQSLGTFRARLGYAMGATGTWLPYVTGGLAVGELKGWDAFMPASGTAFAVGWTVGGGVETSLTQNWTVKVEYLFVDIGSRQLFNVVPGVPETVSFTANIVRAGINYNF